MIREIFYDDYLNIFSLKVTFICLNESDVVIKEKITKEFLKRKTTLDVLLLQSNDLNIEYDNAVIFGDIDIKAKHVVKYHDDIKSFVDEMVGFFGLDCNRLYDSQTLILLADAYKNGFIVDKNLSCYSYLVKKIDETIIDSHREEALCHFYGYNGYYPKESLAIYHAYLTCLAEESLYGYASLQDIELLAHFLFEIYRIDDGLNVLKEHCHSLNKDHEEYVDSYLSYIRRLIEFDKKEEARKELEIIRKLNKNNYQQISFACLDGMVSSSSKQKKYFEYVDKVDLPTAYYNSKERFVSDELLNSPKKIIYDDVQLGYLKASRAMIDKWVFVTSYLADEAAIKESLDESFFFWWDLKKLIKKHIANEIALSLFISILPYTKEQLMYREDLGDEYVETPEHFHRRFGPGVGDSDKKEYNKKGILGLLRASFLNRYFDIGFKYHYYEDEIEEAKEYASKGIDKYGQRFKEIIAKFDVDFEEIKDDEILISASKEKPFDLDEEANKKDKTDKEWDEIAENYKNIGAEYERIRNCHFDNTVPEYMVWQQLCNMIICALDLAFNYYEEHQNDERTFYALSMIVRLFEYYVPSSKGYECNPYSTSGEKELAYYRRLLDERNRK